MSGAPSEEAYRQAVRNRIRELRQGIEDHLAERRTVDQDLTQLRAELKSLESAHRHLLAAQGSRTGQPVAANQRRAQRGTADLVTEILTEAGRPMHYQEIYRELIRQGMEPPDSKNPAQAALTRFYRDPRLERTGRGVYRLRLNEEPSAKQGRQRA